jgi:nitrogen fixation NifU-like protein
MYDFGDLYQEIVMDHNRRPRNYGSLKEPTSSTDGYNPLCGDEVTVFLRLEDDKVTEISFESEGCAISRSSASMMTEEIKGKSVVDAVKVFEAFRSLLTQDQLDDQQTEILGDLEVLRGVSNYPARIKCATLSWHALRVGLEGNTEQAVSAE